MEKIYKKEGWKTKPGSLPLLSQLEIVIEVQEERDDSGYPVWITADASTKTSVYNAGKSSAILLAKNNLGLLIETELGDDIAAALTNMVYESVGVMAAFCCKSSGFDNAVFVGAMSDLTMGADILNAVAEIHSLEFILPENGAFAGALGAASVLVK